MLLIRTEPPTHQPDFKVKAQPFSSLFCEYFSKSFLGSIGWKYPVSRLTILSRMNALISITEINSLYDQRPIVEKQASYAFVHPFTESLGGIVADIPVKFVSAVVFNIIFYFLAGLVSRRQSPSFQFEPI